MCGVNGIFAYHPAAGVPQQSELLNTRDFMRARGPDGKGEWSSEDGRCLLGHRRLSIIDTSDRAAQPMVSGDGKLAITFNGEIYNYRQLRAELVSRGAVFKTQSDTEVLLQLYSREGQAMVHRLRGMFAFAIWDGRRNGLFLARDPYGIKPLYIANDGWTFRFASQVKALLAGAGVSRDPEPAGIVGFAIFGSVPEPFTLYQDIRVLPAGHTQWIDCSGAYEPKRFVNFAEVLAAGAANRAQPAELGEHVRAAVLDSVKAHLVSDVEVGVFLSAGVDSGALTGLMRDAGHFETLAITLAFEEFRGTPEDEAPLAAQVAKIYGARHIVRQVGAHEFRDELPAILEAMDQPSIDGVNTWFVAKATKEAGLKVAISGLGGDELLAGYPSFADLPRWRRHARKVSWLPGAGRLGRVIARAALPGLVRNHPKAAGFLEYGGSWAGAYLLRRAVFLPSELWHLLDRELVRSGLRRLNPIPRLALTLQPDPGTDVGRVCALESTHYLRNQLLRDSDWAGMAHGVEIRTPLVDFTLLQALAADICTLVPGAGKAALANAPTLQLPGEIVARKKSGFGVPTGQWMEKSAGSRSKGLIYRQWSQLVLGAQLPLAAELRRAA